MWTREQGHFWPQGYNLNKPGRGLLGDTCFIPNIKALGLVVSDKKSFLCFSLYKPVLNMWPPGRGQFGP